MTQASPEQDSQFAAEHDADVSRERLAEVYAIALDGACRDAGVSMTETLAEFEAFLADLLDVYPKFETILGSVMVADREKERILSDILKNASDMFRRFLLTIGRRGRLDLLRDICRQCRSLDEKNRGVVPVTVTTASPLDASALESLSEKLRSIVGGQPQIAAVVDPDVIGGVIVRVGDTIFDASVATQLDNVRQQMIDRSAHEIQSRRDSFRNSEGN